MLLDVRNPVRNKRVLLLGVLAVGLTGAALAGSSQTLSPAQSSSSRQTQAQPQVQNPAQNAAPKTLPAPAQQTGGPGVAAPSMALPAQRPGLNVVVLDPAHGGTDLGARGTGGIRESEIVLDFAAQLRKALEAQGFQVVQTREGNDNPSLDDRSARANAQRGAVFVTLHIASTGLPGTVRVYVMTDLPTLADATGLIPWDRAQAAYQTLSRNLGDLVQGELAQRFKGSPNVAQTAAVRQLRTTAAPAIAVEVSSVAVEDRADLERMIPGVADAVARGVVAFRPSYVLPTTPGGQP